jgi:S-DNA-T family DNA segregation ATPase FtsK/SpoIIIE
MLEWRVGFQNWSPALITYRYGTQVVDRTSSDMVLGKGKAAQGADASILSEDHKGVGVLVTGPGSFEIVRCDYMDLRDR